MKNWDDDVPTWIDSNFIQTDRLRSDDDGKFFWYKVLGDSQKFLEDFCYHFFFGMSGFTSNITTMDCRPIDDNVPIVIHDEDCDVDDCEQNVFLWLHDINGAKIEYAEARGFDDFITLTDYDIR